MKTSLITSLRFHYRRGIHCIVMIIVLMDTSCVLSPDVTGPQEDDVARIRVNEEPAGANCPDGGAAIHSGIDINGDGRLSDEEIQETAFVCNGLPLPDGDATLEGVFTVENSLDLSILSNYKRVSTIRIVGTGLESVQLPNLERVDSNLEISGNPVLTDLSFPRLASIGAVLTLQHNASLVDLSGFGQLAWGSDIMIIENSSLEDVLSLCTVTSLLNGIYVRNNPRLPTCNAEALASCIGTDQAPTTVVIEGNDDTGSCQ